MRNCIILGSGRSGTSMVAGCLARTGYFMGDHLLPARSANPKGLFEDEEINEINEQILMRVLPSGISVYGNFFQSRSPQERPRWLACLPLGIPMTLTPEIAVRIQRAVGRDPFCYKDPRFCYTLPVWEPFIKDAVFVCMFRHPAVSAASTLKECTETDALRPLNMSYRRALEIWYQMYSHVLQYWRAGGNWLFLHYDQILKCDGLDKLAATTGALIDRSFPELTLARTQTRQPVLPKHLELYRELCRIAEYRAEVNLGSSATNTNLICSSPPIHPLVVAHSSQCGGAENVLHEFVKGLTSRGIGPVVVFPNAGPMEKAIRDLGVQSQIMKMSWCVGPADCDSEQYLKYASDLKERVYALASLIQQQHLNLVITNTAVVLEGALAARYVGIPHIWYVHEMLSRDASLTTLLPLAPFNSLMERLTDKIVVVSHAVKSEIEQFVATDKIEVVYTGLDRAASMDSTNMRGDLFGSDATVPIITFVGALSERKGVRNLIDAAPAVIEKFPQVKFVLAGHETDCAQLVRQQILQCRLQDQFQIVGFREDSLDIIASSDILVLPSLADALPLAVLEAMHLGRPVVATLSGGAAESVVDGVTGLLVPVNDPQALAAALITLLQSPETRHRFGQQARKRAREMFGFQTYLTNWLRVLTSVIDPRQPRLDAVAPDLIDAVLTLFEGAATDKLTRIEQRRVITVLTRMLGSLREEARADGQLLDAHVQTDGDMDVVECARWLAEHHEKTRFVREKMTQLQEQLDRIRNHPLYPVYRWVHRRLKRSLLWRDGQCFRRSHSAEQPRKPVGEFEA